MHPNDSTINDYVDSALGPGDRATVEQHLETCSECRGLAADLRELQRAAAALEPIEPSPDAWTRVEEAIRRESPANRLRLGDGGPPKVHAKAEAGRSGADDEPLDGRDLRGSSSGWAWGWSAAAALLLLATLAGLRLGPMARHTTAVSAPATDAAVASAQAVESELLQAEQHYQKAISGLEQLAAADTAALDPQTAAILQRNLSVIDRAINESRAALKAQPDSEPAQESLFESFKSKIALLQDTVALINEMRKGNEAGAARIISGLKREP